MEERRVTGTCEQCGRTYALRIPVPGSRDLAFERVEAAFGWCVGCGRFIGRACCWRPGPRCTRCAEAAAAGAAELAATGGFAALASTRAAVRELDGAAADFAAVERALVVARGGDAGSAPGAWEDAWLAAAALRARLDSLRDAATVRLRSLPMTDAERATELATDLDEVARSHRVRWRSIASQIAETGVRLAPPADTREVRKLSPTMAPARADAAHELRPIAVDPASTRVPLRVGQSSQAASLRARGHVTGLGTGSATRVKARTEAPERPTPQPRAPAVPRREAPALARATVTGVPSRPTTDRPPRARPMAPTASVAPAPARLPPAAPAAVAVRTSRPGSAPGRGRLIALSMAAGVLAIAVTALAAMVRFPAPDSENARDSGADRPAVGAGSSTVASPSMAIASPSGSSGSEVPINGPIGFNQQRIGRLDPSDLRSVRVLGAPEVAAFPTPFDRSLRLTPPSSALCLPMLGDADVGASSISFDVYLGGAGTDGSIGFSLSPAEADRLAVALVALDGVDREPWYHAKVSDDGDAWVLALTVLDTGMPVIELPLAAEASVADAGPEEACVEWSTRTTDAWIFVDNVRVDR